MWEAALYSSLKEKRTRPAHTRIKWIKRGESKKRDMDRNRSFFLFFTLYGVWPNLEAVFEPSWTKIWVTFKAITANKLINKTYLTFFESFGEYLKNWRCSFAVLTHLKLFFSSVVTIEDDINNRTCYVMVLTETFCFVCNFSPAVCLNHSLEP